jgi:hypothetical protein
MLLPIAALSPKKGYTYPLEGSDISLFDCDNTHFPAHTATSRIKIIHLLTNNTTEAFESQYREAKIF